MSTFIRNSVVRLHDIDAAGILFFAKQFIFAHDTCEEFLAQIDFPLSKTIKQEPFLLPVVHAEAQYLRMVTVGEEIGIHLQIGDIGNTSFSIVSDFVNANGDLVGKVKIVHVSIDKLTKKKIPLPSHLRSALQKFQTGS